MSTIRLSALAAVVLLALGTAAWAEPLAEASGPTEIPRGNILVLDVGGPQRWVIMPSNGPEFHAYVATISGDEVVVAVHKLPIGGDPDPDDPDDPPPDETLADLVDAWADAVGDPATRVKLAAAYGAMLTVFDSIPSPEALVAAQNALNSRVAGANWLPFFEKLKAHLEQNPPVGMAGHRVAWQQIERGLAAGTDNAVRAAIAEVYADDVAAMLRGAQ